MCSARAHVRFTPESDRESGFPQTVMSALPAKADMCGATTDVRLGPEADIRSLYSITSSAAKRMPFGMMTPSALAVLRLTTSSNLVGCSIGSSAGFAPFRIRAT
jgi:hypothetical protein